MKKVWLFGILTVLITASLAFLPHHKAQALNNPNDPNCNASGTYFGRQICQSFYYNYTPTFTSNPAFNPSWTWPNSYGGSNNAASFNSFVQTGLNKCDYSKYNAGTCNRVQLITAIGDSMIIETMLGKGSP